MKVSLIKNQKGQIAIFIVLIFQVLFILFALSLNVAMVAHDKINLQNSLDLSAYYGAKKQAEVLNAMAHINYQMRQNWKLLAWRYRILGTLAQPYGGNQNYWCPQNRNQNTDCSINSAACQTAGGLLGDSYPGYCDANYFICINNDLWRRGIEPDGDQNLCTKEGITIRPVTPLEFPSGSFRLPEWTAAQRGVEELIGDVRQSCPLEGSLNWLMTQLFMTHFRLDQKDRKEMMKELYNKTLKVGRDLDGESIFEGSKTVFKKNLTRTNLKIVEKLSDFGLEKFDPFQNKNFDEIFKKINVIPILQFLYSNSRNSRVGACDQTIGTHNQFRDTYNFFDELQFHPLKDYFNNELRDLFQFNQHIAFQDEDPMKELSLSFYKEKDQILYYALKAEFQYQSKIFSLLSDKIQFKASAFAKAFGGHFGPQPEQSDPLIAVTHSEKAPLSSFPSEWRILLQPNHSRWPGDQWGLIDRRLHDNNSDLNFLNKHSAYNGTQRVYSLEDYLHLNLDIPQDPLARRSQNHHPRHFMRMMELIAVYPNLYDISYYSILANYHQTYFPKICKLLKGSECRPNQSTRFGSSDTGNRAVYIRGDFGWPDTEEYISQNQSEKEVELSLAPFFLQAGDSINDSLIEDPYVSPAQDRGFDAFQLYGGNPNPNTKPYPITRGKLFYKWLAQPLPDQILSSWTNPRELSYEKYKFEDTEFLECKHKAKEDMPVPSACVGMGRSGYSIKMISCEMVKNLSSQPSNIDEYCPN